MRQEGPGAEEGLTRGDHIPWGRSRLRAQAHSPGAAVSGRDAPSRQEEAGDIVSRGGSMSENMKKASSTCLGVELRASGPLQMQ